MEQLFKYCCLLFFLFQFSFSVFSQNEKEFIEGVVSDAQTGEAVVFATIKLKNKALGVVSNLDGSFRIPMRFKSIGDTISISCLGYKKKDILWSTLLQDQENQIKLEPEIFALDGTVLLGKKKKPPTARKIIKRTIENIPKNYPHELFGYVGYYRDYQLKNGNYINLNEAIIKIADQGFQYNDWDITRAQIFDYKANEKFPRDSLADNIYDYKSKNKFVENAVIQSFGGNEISILRIHDPIRNYNVNTFSFINRFNQDLLKNHSLQLIRDNEISGEPMYVIGIEADITISGDNDKPSLAARYTDFNSVFDQNKSKEYKEPIRLKGRGLLYINKRTYAIYRLEYTMLDLSRKKTKSGYSQKKRITLFDLVLEYQEYQGKMYPNYISFQNTFKLKSADFRVEKIELDLEEKCFILQLNKLPIFTSKDLRNHVDFTYKGQKFPLKQVATIEKQLRVFPTEEVFEIMVKTLDLSGKTPLKRNKRSVEFEFSGIRDRYGNLLDVVDFIDYEQYREFFVHRILSETSLPSLKTTMDKNRPIYKNQPVEKPTDFDSFWMNTPLKKTQ